MGGPRTIEEAKQEARDFLHLLEDMDVPHSFELDSVTVASEDNPYQRHWPFCGTKLGDKACLLASNHPGDHSPEWPEGE